MIRSVLRVLLKIQKTRKSKCQIPWCLCRRSLESQALSTSTIGFSFLQSVFIARCPPSVSSPCRAASPGPRDGHSNFSLIRLSPVDYPCPTVFGQHLKIEWPNQRDGGCKAAPFLTESGRVGAWKRIGGLPRVVLRVAGRQRGRPHPQRNCGGTLESSDEHRGIAGLSSCHDG